MNERISVIGIKTISAGFLLISGAMILGFGIQNVKLNYGIIFGWLIPIVVLSPFVLASLALLKYKNWARILFLWLSWITGAFLLYWTYAVWVIDGVIPGLLFGLLPATFVSIICFLTRPKVKQMFVKK